MKTPDNAAGRATDRVMLALKRADVLKYDHPRHPVHYNRAAAAVLTALNEALVDEPTPLFQRLTSQTPTETLFPVLMPDHQRRIYPDCPRAIRWVFNQTQRYYAARNHGGQTLEYLAERGGMTPTELRAVLLCRRYRELYPQQPTEEQIREAIDYLKQFVEPVVSEARPPSIPRIPGDHDVG